MLGVGARGRVTEKTARYPTTPTGTARILGRRASMTQSEVYNVQDNFCFSIGMESIGLGREENFSDVLNGRPLLCSLLT